MKFALLGYPLGHSLSPEIFREIFNEAGVKGSYYLVEIPNRRLFYAFASDALKDGYVGLNVTIPYKIDAYYLAEDKTEIATRVKNANFLFLKNNRLTADNTDYYGFLNSVKNLLSFKAQKAAVIGYGGSARTVICALKDLDYKEIYVIARNVERAKDRLKDFLSDGTIRIISRVDEFRDEIDLIVNASPAGMYPHTEVLPFGAELISCLGPHGLVYDLIYNPPETKLLKEAKIKGFKTMNGLEMLVLQAVKSFMNVSDIEINEINVLKRIMKDYGKES